MEHEKLAAYFSTAPDDPENQSAYVDIRVDTRTLAETLNRTLAETPAKQELLGRLFRLMCDAELSIRMDGLSKTTPMIVRN